MNSKPDAAERMRIRPLDAPETAEARRVALSRVATLGMPVAQQCVVELLLSYALPEDEMFALADLLRARIESGLAAQSMTSRFRLSAIPDEMARRATNECGPMQE